MKITSAEVFVGGPGKNYVTLKIMTDQGDLRTWGRHAEHARNAAG